MLAITAGASAGDLPVAAVLALPILFAAGMTLLDTTDGVLMSKAYDWALVNPVRRVFFNLTTTGFSVGVALVIGSIEVLQLMIGLLHLRGGTFDLIRQLDFGRLGYIVAAMFLLAWGASFIVWRLRRFEDQLGALARLRTVD
jgi:nickel/cobalt transporter (NiCoT) family protein